MYQVFLSFRGFDTRKNFTDHLHTALVQARIHTFKDDDDIERGKNIAEELKKAIKESKISIIVFSRNYAYSKWCLDELVMINKRRKAGKLVVLPVFYNVEPSRVRNQTDSYSSAFDRHEERLKGEKRRVEQWRAALREVGELRGMELNDSHESRFIQDIIREIQKTLHQLTLNDEGKGTIFGIGRIGKIGKTAYHLNFEEFQATEDKYKNDFHDSGGLQNQSVQDLENYALYKAMDTTKSVNKCLMIAENIREVATETIDVLYQQGEQITRTHNMCVDMDKHLSQGVEKGLNNRGGLFSNRWKPKKNRDISGPLITSDNSSKNSENQSEQRKKLGLAPAPKGRSASERTNALQKVEVEKAKQDEALSDLSNILGDLKGKAIVMGTEFNRQNKGLDHLHEDMDELTFRLKDATQHVPGLHGKGKWDF